MKMMNLIRKYSKPIKQNGQSVVKICANCHAEYHNPEEILEHTLQFRADAILSFFIQKECKKHKISFSDFQRALWEIYFDKNIYNAWKKEVEGWPEKPKLKKVI